MNQYILTAKPVGSRVVARLLAGNLVAVSAATIRNEMADLEYLGYLIQPHTSAGRIPTDLGYRFYVNEMMTGSGYSSDFIDAVETPSKDVELNRPSSIKSVSRLIGGLSHYLGIVSMPRLLNSVIEGVQIVPLSSSRVLMIVELEDDAVRTVSLEFEEEVDQSELQLLSTALRDRLAGRTLTFVRDNLKELMTDIESSHPELIRMVIDASQDLLYQTSQQRIHVSGAGNLLQYPELVENEGYRSVIELVENEDIIVHLLEDQVPSPGQMHIAIGSEMGNNLMHGYSLIATSYAIDKEMGTIGLIGPKRMNYAKMMQILSSVATLIEREE